MAPKDLPAIESLIPHRAPMRLIDRVVDLSEEHIETMARVTDAWPLCGEDGADVILTVEMIAQSVAALYHERKKRLGEPQIDFLVGIKEARFLTPKLPLDAELRVRVSLVSMIGNYGIFQGDVLMGSERLCEATLQVLDPGEDLWAAVKCGRKGQVTDHE